MSTADCVFDVPSDGIPRGSEYVASLEARIASLESELRSVRAFSSPPDQLIPDDGSRQLGGHGAVSLLSGKAPLLILEQFLRLLDGGRGQLHILRGLITQQRTPSPSPSSLQNSPESTSEITSFNMLQGGTTTSEMQASTLPELPSQKVGHLLLETVYLYIQARYCIVDWVQLREWHQRRETICYSTKEDDLDSQTGAYFIWIIYAIGAGFVPNPEYPPKAYFARALKYLHPILTLQNSTTVQALLCLCQFHFRTTVNLYRLPIPRHLSGIIMRLCVELGYHRKASSDVMDPLAIELQKRFFWCAYCFDRLVSTMARRPFGIHDLDIDTPVNVNIESTDSEQLEYLQSRQRAGEDGCQIGGLTSMSSALHHLEFYRLKSRIMTRLFGPHALPPTYEDVQELLSKLDKWMATAPRNCPNSLPQQSEIRKQGFYLQAVLLTMRPVLIQQSVDEHLLLLCAGKAADACEVTLQATSIRCRA
ncbi:hypothetical protein PV08_04225 [Exophiala spinifera]|uniref:Xylanolytic transcriptional activator regulatory domain-containing protein n=1 Tax=Exophiala spinifera TaxID=91928 RepID=A0A0D2C0C3_9EURO|nr:uncharacterized protein PV08_04225 [Exophiala spinifera]KIW17034.1 hypothetical protein PV08_04225 [Exophiala spinifera]